MDCLASQVRRVTPGDLGFRADRPFQSVLFGALAWFLFGAVYQLMHGFKSTKPDVREFVRTERMIWARRPAGRVLMSLILAINPITEEFICRGVMVVLVHRATGNFAAAVAFGWTICMLVHVYQGPGALLSHTLFFIGAVVLIYSACGLLAAIVFHAFGDWLPFLKSRERMDWVRAERAGRRTAKAPAVP
jgi:membrane protease YdiL (CAAX protease family)